MGLDYYTILTSCCCIVCGGPHGSDDQDLHCVTAAICGCALLATMQQSILTLTMAIRRRIAGQAASGKGVSKGKSKRSTKCNDNKSAANGKGCIRAIAKKPAAKGAADTQGKAVIRNKADGQKTTDKRSGRDKGKAVVVKKPAAKDTDKKTFVLMEDGFRNFKYILM